MLNFVNSWTNKSSTPTRHQRYKEALERVRFTKHGYRYEPSEAYIQMMVKLNQKHILEPIINSL